MIEELLDDSAYRRLAPSGQQSLIAEYCGGIEQRILSAPTADDARVISDDACRLFREECASELIRRALTDHVTGLYEKYWTDETS
ncbi:MAG: hypothetical protein WEB33_06020 [Bacteroidota bacterium]